MNKSTFNMTTGVNFSLILVLHPACLHSTINNGLAHFLMTLTVKPFENIVGKGENAGNQRFLLSSEC